MPVNFMSLPDKFPRARRDSLQQRSRTGAGVGDNGSRMSGRALVRLSQAAGSGLRVRGQGGDHEPP